MKQRLITATWLTSLWIILWRDLSIANLLSGMLLAAVVSQGVARPRPDRWRHRLRPVALVRFALVFAWKLVEANIVLAREVVTPENVIHTGIVAVPMPGRSDFVVSIVANAISLTPGTLTLEVRRRPEPVLYVHVLHLHDVERARRDVIEMAERADAAFPLAEPHLSTPEATDR